MQRLIDQRDQLLREIEALRNKVAGIEMAISLLDSDGKTANGGGRSTKSVKAVLLDFLQEVGTTGLSPTSAVEMANRRGMTLNPGSVSSTLSRFKKDGIVVLQGDRYRLPQFVQQVAGETTVRALWENAARAGEAVARIV